MNIQLNICSFVGRIALDPAGALFQTRGLNKTCAKLVQVLHTNGEFLGTFKRVGHQDFYANYHLAQQPGCADDGCSHGKVLYFNYASLFLENAFVGRDCENLDSPNAKTSRYGKFNDDQVEGIFCFNTTDCFPYVLPMEENVDGEINKNYGNRLMYKRALLNSFVLVTISKIVFSY